MRLGKVTCIADCRFRVELLRFVLSHAQLCLRMETCFCVPSSDTKRRAGVKHSLERLPARKVSHGPWVSASSIAILEATKSTHAQYWQKQLTLRSRNVRWRRRGIHVYGIVVRAFASYREHIRSGAMATQSYSYVTVLHTRHKS